MNEENHNDLFEMRVNETSKKIIWKTYPLISITIIVNILLSLILIFISAYSLRHRDATAIDSLWDWYLLVYPFYMIVYTIIATVGGYYYFLFIKKMRKALIDSDEQGYNLSFMYVYRNVVLFMISMIMAFLFSVIELVSAFVAAD
jgi:hypothetical protein